jgi:hypothetical protein
VRKLFTSFSGLILLLSKDEQNIQQEDLDSGLFYFGCVREHLFGSLEEDGPEPSKEDLLSRKWSERIAQTYSQRFVRRKQALARIRETILKAEEQGRVLWRPTPADERSYSAFNAFLTQHGLTPINLDDLSHDRYSLSNDRFHSHDAAALLATAGELEVWTHMRVTD